MFQLKYFIFILSLFYTIEEAFAQINYVQNYSFENYTFCPSAPGQLPLAVPWTSPTNNSGEYFNGCSTSPYYNVPDQFYNFQEARSGTAFIGLFLYNGPNSNYREYAQVQLLNSLSAGQCYYVEFFTNRATGTYGGKYAVNNIGCYFSNTAVNTTGTGYVLNLTPHVLEFNNAIITDTVNWVKISGVYTAVGGEQYITIGNFANDIDTDTLTIEDVPYKSAVYFFDDVSITPIDSITGGMSAYAGVDTSITLGDSVFIGQEISNLNCNWYDSNGILIASSISGIYVNPTVSTYYVVEQTICGYTTYDTVTVTVLPTGIDSYSNKNAQFEVYPNPANNAITIKSQESIIAVFKLSDLTGKEVLKQHLTTNITQIDIQTLPKGIYFYQITNKKEQYSGKLVVQ